MQLTLDVEPLLSARAAEQEIARSSLARKFGKGRVVFDASGMMQRPYDGSSRLIIQRSALWATGQL